MTPRKAGPLVLYWDRCHILAGPFHPAWRRRADTMSEQPIQDTTTDFKPVEGPVRDSVPYLAPDLPLYFVPRAELETVKRLLLSRPAASLAPITLHGPAGSARPRWPPRSRMTPTSGASRWRAVGLAAGEGSIQHAQMLWGGRSAMTCRVPDTAAGRRRCARCCATGARCSSSTT